MDYSRLGLPVMQHSALGSNGQPRLHGVLPYPQLGFPGFPSQAMMPYLPGPGMFPNLLYRQQPSQYFSNEGENPYLYPTANSSNIFLSPSLLSQAAYHGTTARSAPEFSAADEQLLARVISAEKMKLSLAEIFRSLDGMNNHTTEQWLTFYMNNSNRVNDLRIGEGRDEALSGSHGDPPATVATVKSSEPKSKPTSATRYKGRALRPRSSDSRSAVRGKGQVKKTSLGHRGPRFRLGTVGRATPPGSIVPIKGGNKFSDADKVFFKKTLRLVLAKYPNALRNKTDLARKLNEEAPHHSLFSWRSWMRDNEDDITRLGHEILREVGENPANVTKSNEEGPALRTRQHLAQLLAEADSEISLMSSDSEGEIRAQDDLAANGSHSGSRGYLPSEKRGLAKFIANITLSEWDRTGGAARWQEFQAMYPRHTEHAWRNWYRLNKQDVRRQAKRFEIRNAKRQLEMHGTRHSRSAASVDQETDTDAQQSTRRYGRTSYLSQPIKLSLNHPVLEFPSLRVKLEQSPPRYAPSK